MTKQREILSNGTLFNCELCDKKDMKSTGFSNHVNSMHVKKENISSLEEYYKLFINIKWGNSNNLCKFCNKQTKFMSIFEGYSEFCSHKCSVSTDEHKEIVKIKYKNSMLEKHGVEHSSKLLGFSDKVKATKLKNHGDEKFNNIEKTKLTNLERYGVENYAKSNEYVEKTRLTSLEKYGVEHFTQNEEVKNKTKLTNLERYGFENPMKNIEIYNKLKETNLKRYGVTSCFSLKHSIDKARKIRKDIFNEKLENYEFDNVNLLDLEKRIFQCKNCQQEFVFYNNITLSDNSPSRFPHCEKCKPIGKNPRFSLLQQNIESFLKELCDNKGYKMFVDDKTLIKSSAKEIDFYIPNINLAIEVDGIYYHMELNGNKTKYYHLDKTTECEKYNTKLIHIFSDEWNDKKKIIKSKLKYLLNDNSSMIHIGSRKCKIQSIPWQNSQDFIEENHLQGKENSNKFRYGAFYNNELVACMTFGQERISLGSKNHTNKNEFELLRFCTKIGYVIPGVASRLFSCFIKENNPDKIISYADRRWSSSINKDTVYQKLGFAEVHKSEPNYFYLLKEDNYRKRHNRYKFRKSELNRLLSIYDPALSEWENMKNNGHDRIWDCGTIKYEWKNNSVQKNIQLGSFNS